ncbi:MAG: hypothetical protein IRY98_07985 [Alicyclobacillaceae bacterium]|nr:hypothetical protein [Alicyclobacillaceae bacterium]
MIVPTPRSTDWVALIADLKETEYQNTLLLTALLEWLIEAGIVERQAILRKMKELDPLVRFRSRQNDVARH